MSKQSPFFKFDVSDWLSGSIQFLGYEEKGLFIDLCALYWQKQEPLKIDAKFKIRSSATEERLSDLIVTLSDLELITKNELGITVPFLDRLMIERQQFITNCSRGGKNSANKKGHSSNKKEERRKKKEDKKTINKKSYAEFVDLTDEEYQKVIDKYGCESIVLSAIERLNNYKGSNGKKYKSDYHVLIGWVYEKVEEEGGFNNTNNSEIPKQKTHKTIWIPELNAGYQMPLDANEEEFIKKQIAAERGQSE